MRPFATSLRDEVVVLECERIYAADESPWGVPAYRFLIVTGGVRAGTISLRVSNEPALTSLAGHLGFEIDPAHRGRGLAVRAARLLFSLARHHGLVPLRLTTTADNLASQRAIERLGGVPDGVTPVPPAYPTYATGEREKLRYRIDL